MKELKEIFGRLDMSEQNGLLLTAKNGWDKRLPVRVAGLLKDKLKPDAFFCINNKPIVLFYNSPTNKEELFKAIWNFNESPVVIINEPSTVEIFNGLSYLREEKTLEKLEDDSSLNNFSYFELVTGKTWQNYENKLKYQNRVDYKLLENIKAARDLLVSKHHIDSSLSNALIGKCIFIRYLIDRNVCLEFESSLRTWSKDEFCKLLGDKRRTIRFLNYLKDRFNGEAFLLEDSQLENIPDEAFDILQRLMRGTEIKTGQMSLFDIYDFSIIPVEFISNVYEHFIGGENQAKKGAYYTPLFLVDYIISETVEKYFIENPEEYNCKILDPACGSGIFLVEALRRMIERYQKINKITSSNTNSFKELLRKLAEENIYGIDKDDNAINVAVFSVYLALLDYQEPKEIENFKFPKLINRNFFTSDSFELDAYFNNIINKINFDFILGNPPWKRGSNKNALFLKYIGERKKKESSKADGKPLPIPTVSNKEIAQAFLLRTSDFSSVQTRCALIVNSKTLYNLNAKNFRRYFLHNYFIDKVFELAPVRREVFDKSNDPSIAPAAILFFHYAHDKATDKNVIEHIALKPNRFFSLFKVFVLQRNDYKQVIQSRLIEYDWLWKILVYGSYLDFNFVKRLKEEYKTISAIINNSNLFLVGQGIMVGGGDKNDVSYLLNQIYVDTGKDIAQFYINLNPKNIWSQKYVHRPRNKYLFNAPILLITEGINKRLESVSAISYKNCVFKSSLTGVKLKDSKKLNVLIIINGLLNSNLFSYNILQTGSSAGIEREQTQDEEKFSFPYLNNSTIAEYVERIEAISKKLFQEKRKPLNSAIQTLEDEKKKLINNLNEEILSSFNLNEQERALVDYAVNITIPLIMRHKDYEKELFLPLRIKDAFLTNYAGVFINRFQNSFERRDKKFTIQILHSNHIIGMFFRVTDEEKNKEQIVWENKSEGDMLLKLSSLGCQKITESLFMQKDVRGFERDGFYIIKPNEKKLWHKAIAYLDAEEFADAMLRNGDKEKQNA
ncbi:MAG: SAM-dependent methyltransferase [Candidatus Jettenia sp.]|nr:SAM-dependent methyltransferase [Candidatus Jettenia sp.]